MRGSVIGGQQPISGATIKLYVAGSTGYGSAATYATGNDLLGSNTVTTNSSGGFGISGDYTCPTAGSLVYIVASGGNPGLSGTVNNTASVLVTALGACGNLNSSTYIHINELTTAATAFALGQFFTPAFGSGGPDTIGAPSSNLIGITNAFATAQNLVNTATGTAAPTTPASGTNFYLSANDQEKLNTIGNIIAACINTTGPASSGCSSLFSYVTPTYAPFSASTTATPASDTFQAAVYMSLNPTSTNANSSSSNLNNLFALESAFAPYSPALTAAPTDWTLAINYSGTGISYNSSVAVDANGDIWLSNANNTGGVALVNGGTGLAGGTPGVTGGVVGFWSTLGSVTANQTRQVVVDLNGKAWFGGFAKNVSDSNYYMFRANNKTGVEGTFVLPSSTTEPYAVAIDPTSGNVFATAESANILTTSATTASGTAMTVEATLEGNCTNSTITIDSASNAYVPCGSGNDVYEFSTAADTAISGSPFSSSDLSTPYGSALDGQGRIWFANNGATSMAYLSGPGSSGTFTGVSSSCLSGPRFIAIDGSDNLWVTNGTGIGTGSTNFTVCEFNSSGALISNSTGYGLHGVNTGRGIAIDPAGNVWVSSYNNSATNVTEIVGAATPVVTPIVYAIKNGKVGTRPDVFAITPSTLSPVVEQNGTPTSDAFSIVRPNGDTNSITVSASGLPTGLTASFTQPGTGSTGSVSFVTSSTPAVAGTYTVTLTATDGTNTTTATLSVTVAVVATLNDTVNTSLGISGYLHEFMSTGFQPDTYDNPFFVNFPSTTNLTALDSQHIRIQPVTGAIPWLANSSPQEPTDWGFTALDQTVQPLVNSGDESPIFQIAIAPSFLDNSNGQFNFNTTNLNLLASYAANLVRYYNTGGFTWGGQHFQSASSNHITWWAIFNEPNLNGLTAAQYVQLYNTLVPAMLAVDPTLKFTALELSDYTGQPQNYMPTLVAATGSGGINPAPNALATHFYGTCNQSTTDAVVFSNTAQFVSDVTYIRTELDKRSDLANVPVWVTENNVNADYAATNGYSTCNPTQLFVSDPRGTDAFFAAWRPYLFSQLGKAGNQALYHFLYEGSSQYGEVSSSNASLYLSYWVDKYLEQTFPWPNGSTGPTILPVTSTEATPSVEILAVLNADSSVSLMVIDYAVYHSTDDNGVGQPRTVMINTSAMGSFTSGTLVTVGAGTNITTGPATTSFTPTPTLTVNLTGYGTAFIKLTP